VFRALFGRVLKDRSLIAFFSRSSFMKAQRPNYWASPPWAITWREINQILCMGACWREVDNTQLIMCLTHICPFLIIRCFVSSCRILSTGPSPSFSECRLNTTIYPAGIWYLSGNCTHIYCTKGIYPRRLT
jgi:hypothetical protein